MKKISYILLVLFSFVFIQNVNAEVFSNAWRADWTSPNGTVNKLSGSDYVNLYGYSKATDGNFLPRFEQLIQIPTGATSVRFHILVSSYSETLSNHREVEYACKYNSLDGSYDGSECYRYYQTFYTMGNDFSFIASISDSENKTNLCSAVTNSTNGALIIDCPLSFNFLDIKAVTFEILSNQRRVFLVGIGANLTFVYPDTQNIVDNQNTNTQKQIDAMNKNQEQANKNSQNEVNAMNKNTQATQEQTNTIKDSNVDVDDTFFSGFDNETHGLTSIVTAPLQLIGSITSSTCSTVSIPLPFVKTEAQLPCMSNYYKQYFGVFFTLYQTITFSMVAYWVCVKVFFMVKGFKDPDSDRIEVLDL